MQTVSEYLQLRPGTRNELSVLQRLSTVGTRYAQEEILRFYTANYTEILEFEGGARMSLSQIFYRLVRPLGGIDDSFYSLVAAHCFVSLNDIHYGDRITLDDLPALNEHIERGADGTCYKKLGSSERAIRMINRGVLSPYMFDVCSDSIELRKSTFRFLITSSVSVPALMGYEMDAGEVEMLVSEMAGSPGLRDRCAAYINDQGVINTTIFVISRLLGMDKRGRNVDHRRAGAMLCSEHDGHTHIPFSSFRRIGDLDRSEVYFLYLSSKTDFTDDIPDIREFFDCWDPSAPASIPDDTAADRCSLRDTDDTCLSLTPLTFPRPGGDAERDIYVQTLRLLLGRGVDIGFHRKAFTLLLRLESEGYFTGVLCRYGRDMVECGLRPAGNPRMYDDIERNLRYLGMSVDTQEVPCSLDSADSVLFSSGQSGVVCDTAGRAVRRDISIEDPIDASLLSSGAVCRSDAVPVLRFGDHPWIRDSQRILLLENYLRHHSVDDLVDNFLLLSKTSSTIDSVFASEYPKIQDSVRRGLAMCRLSIEIGRGTFSRQTVRALLDGADALFSLRAVVLFEKVGQRHIAKFLESLNPGQEDEIYLLVRSSIVTQDFVLSYIPHLARRYEFSHISDILMFFVDSYREPVVVRVQKYIISLMADMFFVETYFEPIGMLYRRMMAFGSKRVRVLNESILSMVLACGRAMDRELFIGNVKDQDAARFGKL